MTYEQQRAQLLAKITTIRPERFVATALELFQFQWKYNALYQKYCTLLQVNPAQVTTLEDIPFLPISFFKTATIQTVENNDNKWQASLIFSSSGTTGSTTSRHHLNDIFLYNTNAQKGFEHFYGNVCDYCVLALLPSYLERSGSSLVFMAQHFIDLSAYKESGFFLSNISELVKIIQKNEQKKIPTLLIGVSFALLDLAETYSLDLKHTIVMETGGMKGRRKEITRPALHKILQDAFHTSTIHSEYGMTELLSQAYSKEKGIFYPAPTMRVLTREISDPLAPQKLGKTGGINIIDLVNLDSCAFIATEDLGRVYANNGFEILGRFDASDVRGCNLMVL